jgi:outer membrane receptor for ferric coprogen and ferric-rhodotorulic acid
MQVTKTILGRIMMALTLCILIFSGTANAQTRQFDIPPGDLKAALDAYVVQAGVQLIYRVDEVRGVSSLGAHGMLDPAAALDALLARTGFTFVRDSVGAVAIVKVHVPPLPKTSSDATNVESIFINGKLEGLAAMRVPTELKEIPQSVSVISQDTLKQQNSNDLADALTWATGITVTKSNSTDDQFYSRGFAVTSFHIDGGAPLSMGLGTSITTFSDLSEYDHIEILRGADALFGGSGSPSATVSLARKKPLADSQVNVTASLGSWDNGRVESDLTGPLGDDGRLRGRLILVDEGQHYFYDTANTCLSKAYGVMDYDLTSSTVLTFGGSTERMNSSPFVSGLPFYADGSDAHLPRSTALTFPWNDNTSNKNEGFAGLQQRFNDDWKLSVNATVLSQSQDSFYGSYASAISPITNMLLGMPSASAGPASSSQRAADATLTGAFDWGGRRQEVIIGVDYHTISAQSSAAVVSLSGHAVNPFEYDSSAFARPAVSTSGASTAIDIDTRQIGLYGAVRLRPWNDWTFIGGARGNDLRNSEKVDLLVGGVPLYSTDISHADHGKLTPYAGVVYDVNQQYAIYASYADVFNSNDGELHADGTPLAPTTGLNLEAGIKAEWFGKRLNGSLAMFKIDESGVGVADPGNLPTAAHPTCCYVSGSNTSHGVEAEISGKLTKAWTLIGGYTFNENHSVSGGNLQTQTPKNLFKLWTNYQFLQGWSLGGGLTAQSSNYTKGTACTAFSGDGKCIGAQVPFNSVQGSYAVATLRAAYQINQSWLAALNINNLFDRSYYQTIGTPTSGNWYGEPRNLMFTLRGSL